MLEMLNRKNFLFGMLVCLLPFLSVAQGNVEGFEENYRQGAARFSQGDFEAAGTFFANAYDASPHQQAALMAARSFALAGKTDQVIDFVRKSIHEGRYVFDHPEFEPYAENPDFENLMKQAQTRLDYMHAESPEPRFIIPYNFSEDQKYPLMVFLPGHGAGANMFEPGYLDAANEFGFIWMVVRGGRILGEDSFTWEGSPEEVKRIALDISKAKAKYPIDSSRIFLLGYDVGSTPAWKFQAEFPDLLAGIGQTPYEMPDGRLLLEQERNDLQVFVLNGVHYAPGFDEAFSQNQRYYQNNQLSVRRAEAPDFFGSLWEMLGWFID